MADWKEKGFVPDSDDEGDLDISNTESDQNWEGHRQSNGADIDTILRVWGDARQDDDEVDIIQSVLSSPESELHPKSLAPVAGEVVGEGTQLSGTPVRITGPNRDLHLSSPLIVDVFKFPEPLSDSDEGEIRPSLYNSGQHQALDVPEQDDISKTYVRITSVNSSLLSSPPQSQSNQLPQQSSIPATRAIVPAHDIAQGMLREEEDRQTPQNELALPPKRSFRPRNAIQLHPYAVEGEKFRRTFKARGLAPVRIAESQQGTARERSRDRSADPESQGGESLEVVIESFETQDFDWDPPSSPPRPSSQLEVDEATGKGHVPDDDDDYDFPNVDELLNFDHQKTTLPKSKAPTKHRQQTYSNKFKRPPPVEIVSRKTKSKRSSLINHSRPASPPTTSSPLLPPRDSHRSLSRVSSNASSRALSWAAEIESSKAADLPTPATSAMKPQADPIFIDSISESDDPFASDPGQLSSAQSSSDEAVQLQKVSKKIRGVLPASHLRLDIQSKKLPAPINAQRQSLSASPVKGVAQRVNSRPKSQSRSQNPRLSTFGYELSDSSESEDNSYNVSRTASPHLPLLASLFDDSRIGDAEEEDSIDAMLPTRKRRSSGLNRRPYKKRMVPSGQNRQPKITEHLKRPRNSAPLGERPAKRAKTSKAGISRVTKHSARPQRFSPPRLGILDVIDLHDNRDTPQFLKVAARAARSRKGQGRQSPTRKFIRLATREDTQDVQSILGDWKRGEISIRLSADDTAQTGNITRLPLSRIEDNQQTKFPSTQRSRLTQAINIGPRKLAIASRAQQQSSMQDFMKRQPVIRLPPEVSMLKSALKAARQSRNRPLSAQLSRPAQLEATELDYSRRNPSAAFVSTKKTLDSAYRTARKRSDSQRNLQLNRFLEDEDVVRPSVETDIVDLSEVPEQLADENRPKQPFRRKRPPKRIDAGAAIYRQPSEPLILDYLVREQTVEATGDANKLQGLGKFGTKYPIHFDIFPLQGGIYFHRDTLIGSGRLRRIITRNDEGYSLLGSLPSFKIDNKIFRWESWDETVSSEIGICFDWVVERLGATQTSSSTTFPSAVEVIEFALDYVQHHVRFNSSLTAGHFLSRLLQIVRDFSSRVTRPNREQLGNQQLVDVLSTTTVLVFALLRVAQTNPDSGALVFELEDLLRLLASRCVDVLLSDGVGTIRILYDNLQYLSFRESGIKKNDYAANAWVTLIQILGAARIPRGSFWDVVNSQIPLSDIKSIQNAPALETLWYTMYTLLPLCEFDDHGVVVPGLRQASAFDNWQLCQSLLQRVFLFYRSDQRQSPGFNDYCRTVINRCHYLMTEWGWWKCSGIIGTIFDIFAEQKLSHLRNEEVYHSPRFLEELDQSPSLEVEAEDRCFHIFLKIVALGIRHLNHVNDIKSIRNLVARILPNHDRQFPKEEIVRRRDLASLRNHHDLLCTLFWTAPASQRPPLSLIQGLIIADRSHNEACLISLRAWENLARFLATSKPDLDVYQPFRSWQSSFFNAVCEQYLEAEHEIRQQAEALERQGGNVDIEATISTTVKANRRTIMVMICRSINAMASTIKIASTDAMAKQIFNKDVLAKALDPAIYNDKQLSCPLLDDVVRTLYNYMDQIDRFCPVNSATPAAAAGESQDSLDMSDVNWGRLEMANSLGDIAKHLGPIVKMYTELEFDQRDPTANFQLIDCWARLISILAEDDPKELQKFLIGGQQAVFENRLKYGVASNNWTLFLAKILEHRNTADGFPPGFNVGAEWLLALTRAQQISAAETALTLQMSQKGYYLCNSPYLCRSNRVAVLRHAIRKMSTLLLEDRTSSEIGIAHRDAKRLFSDMLGEVMKTMQQVLESLIPNSDAHKHYLDFARAVVTDIKCYANDYRPLTEYFIHPSKSYWPHDSDPNLYAAGIISYCIRLSQQSQKTSFELFYYLHGGWKNALISHHMENFTSHIKKAMKRWDFTRFMLAEFVPAILDAGFTAGGWLLCQSFLRAISRKISYLLDQVDGNASWTFELILNTLKMIMNGTSMLSQTFRHDIQGVHPDHRGILAVVFEFWFSIAPIMRQYVERHPDLSADLTEVTDPLSSFIYNTIQGFSTGELESPFALPTGQFDVLKGKHTDRFREVMVQDIHQHWTFNNAGFEVVVMNRGGDESGVQMVRDTLSEVLNGELPGYEALFEDKEGVELPRVVCKMTMDIFF